MGFENQSQVPSNEASKPKSLAERIRIQNSKPPYKAGWTSIYCDGEWWQTHHPNVRIDQVVQAVNSKGDVGTFEFSKGKWEWFHIEDGPELDR
jgi:hypothetical protein